MPILTSTIGDSESHIHLKFGEGDISVGSRMANNIGLMTFELIEPHPIGGEVKVVGEMIFSMSFDNPDSISVLLGHLNKLKGRLIQINTPC